MHLQNCRILGIIGVGPRGLFALEQFIFHLALSRSEIPIKIYLFEATGKFGTGENYDIDQAETNWINVSERGLSVSDRPEIHWQSLLLPAFPSYQEWSDTRTDSSVKTPPDRFPPRSVFGNYLKSRFETFVQPLVPAGIVLVFADRVEEITIQSDGRIELITTQATYRDLDEIVLTIGHQPTELSDQLLRWQAFCQQHTNLELFLNPYPVKGLLTAKNLRPDGSVGIRGFGLAMIDVVRAIASKFGQFRTINEQTRECSYESVHDLSGLMVPFSLDGLPPAPKPLNAQIDRLYMPAREEILGLEQFIGNASNQREAQGTYLLVDAIAPIAASIYLGLPQAIRMNGYRTHEIEQLVREWLLDENHRHPLFTQPDQLTAETMKSFVGMASGTEMVTLDFCIGQVWRHCQPSIYGHLSFNRCSDEVFAALIRLNERMKRLANGPPVESIRQLLALVSAGALNLAFINNPRITLSGEGWELHSNGQVEVVDVMINSVLDPPNVNRVDSPIVKHLRSDHLIRAVHSELGVLTDQYGYCIPEDGYPAAPIALLGRLAKGTIIGADSISECFGERPKNWAKEAAKRIVNGRHSGQS